MMEYKRILAVDDVHGQYDKLVSLYSQMNFNPEEDLLIFLGDYIQGGEKPCEVLDWLMQHQQKNTIFIRGNTDQMILDAYKHSSAGSALWIPREKRQKMASVYYGFLASLPFSYEVIRHLDEDVQLKTETYREPPTGGFLVHIHFRESLIAAPFDWR